MKKIYKYGLEITDTQDLLIVGFREVLSVTVQYGNLALYAVVDTEDPKTTSIAISIRGTGHNYDLDSSWTFLGTHQMAGGNLIWHVWYKL